MSTWQVKKTCLSCRHFRLTDESSGVCRVDKGNGKPYPLMLPSDSCPRWTDCGQQYYIRTGWLKRQKEQAKEGNKH